MKETHKTRRSLLRSVGTSSAVIGGIVMSSAPSGAASSSKTGPDDLEQATERKVREFYTKRYPAGEAEYLASRWSHYRQLVLEESMPRDKAFAMLTADLQEDTTEVRRDGAAAERHHEARSGDRSSADGEYINTSSTETISASSTPPQCGGQYSVPYSYNKYTDKGGTGTTSARTLDPNQVEANSTGYGYANCYALAERGGNYFSEQDGKVNISIESDFSGSSGRYRFLASAPNLVNR